MRDDGLQMTDDKYNVMGLNGAPIFTPEKNPLVVPTQALADAIAEELAAKKPSSSVIRHPSSAMPLTALAYTAIDRIGADKENIIEVLLAYVDTDTLCYRASAAPDLEQRQKKEWDPVLAWAGAKWNALWQTTSGVMPLKQPQALHQALRDYLGKMDAMPLAALSVLASLYSSLLLALAVLEKEMTAERAFALSRLEETFQAEQWGRDEEASARAGRILEEIKPVARFLELLATV